MQILYGYIIITFMKMSREKLSRLRQRIYLFRKRRGVYLDKLLRRPKPMVIGSLYKVYKTCSKPNCCCQKGRKHGPFPALSISIGGNRRIKMIRREDLSVVKEKALAYQNFQQGLAEIRKINKEIDKLLEEIKKGYLEEYQ